VELLPMRDAPADGLDDLEEAADMILAALRDAGADSPGATLVGCSFGFWRAVHLLTTGRVVGVRGLVGLGPVLDLSPEARAAFRGAAPLVSAGIDLGAVLVAQFLSPGFAAKHPEVAEEVAAFCRAADPSALGRQLLAAADAPLLVGALAAVEVPLYLRVGALDIPAPPASVQAIAANVRNAQVDVVPDVGHLLASEDAQGTARALLRWMRAGQ
jgi:pimeloyl-ACP methyl ester carboxylesterase